MIRTPLYKGQFSLAKLPFLQFSNSPVRGHLSLKDTLALQLGVLLAKYYCHCRVGDRSKCICRTLSLSGALLLLLAEAHQEAKSLFAGVPTLGQNRPRTYLQLTGRVLLVFMFLTLLRVETSLAQMLQTAIASSLMLLVAVGFKTKLSALCLVLWLTAFNFWHNAWWTASTHINLRDFLNTRGTGLDNHGCHKDTHKEYNSGTCPRPPRQKNPWRRKRPLVNRSAPLYTSILDYTVL
ncbi:SURF4 [Cordylochernes scorpioides]|uniref:SURF4 n=1 Tax=Cordylochernes scorpioides TaxID=51811 RepID=A0ABY6KQ78_9ARAC|nr:SURF4 [Cordylochernes scorpioides]